MKKDMRVIWSAWNVEVFTVSENSRVISPVTKLNLTNLYRNGLTVS